VSPLSDHGGGDVWRRRIKNVFGSGRSGGGKGNEYGGGFSREKNDAVVDIIPISRKRGSVGFVAMGFWKCG